jgi:hypothetical protein
LVLLGAVGSNLGCRGRPVLVDQPLRGQAAKAARQLASDLVVVSEVQAVTLPANRPVDLRCCCPWLSPGDRCSWVVRGPSAAHVGHAEGTAGEQDMPRSLSATAASSGDG